MYLCMNDMAENPKSNKGKIDNVTRQNIQKYSENVSIKELSSMYGINFKTITSIINLYKKQEELIRN